MIGTTVGPYEIIGKLGAGGMGEVYRARDTQLERDVAVKVLPEAVAADAELLQRFEREARTLASLNHPNIAQVYGMERGESTVIVMELVEGEDLSERLQAGPLDLEEALPIARQVAEGLEAAHAAGIVHRDLKPANVKVRDDDTVKVLDFGLAKPNAVAAASSTSTNAATMMADSPTMMSPTLTGAGMILGSAAYMSPEQARGKPVDHRADVWAFGCLLFEMLAGQRAFAGEDASMTLASVLKHDVDWSVLPGATPAEVRRLIERCLETDPRRRYQAIGDARFEIESWLAEGFAAPAVETVAATAATRAWQHPALAAIAVLAAAAIGFAASRLTVPAPAPDPVTRLALVREGHADIALSPDGDLLALADEEGLWVRARDEEALRLLPAAGVDVAGPFFSPGGRWIGYFAADQLRKVPLDGGPSLPINTRPLSFRFCGSAAWGSNDQVVFQCSDSGGLWVVPAAGGEQSQLTTGAAGERMHASPSFLPDGRTVIFSRVSRGDAAEANGFEISMTSVDGAESGEVHAVGLEGRSPRYVSTGHLLFAREQALWAVAFDPGTLTVTGEPFPVIENVTAPSQFGNAYFAVSETGSLAYWSGPFVRVTPRYPAIVDRDGGPVSEFPDLMGTQRARLSPDGRRLVLDSGNDQGATPAVSVVDVVRGTVNRVGSGNALGWSGDGSAVFYGIAGEDGFNIYRRPWDLSTDAELVTTLPAFVSALSWAPGSDTFVFTNVRGDRANGISSDIGLWSAQTGIEWLLESGAQETAPTLSPDGRWLAYQYAEAGARQESQVFIRPFPGPGGRIQVSIGGGRTPRWSGDNRRIYFANDGSIWETLLDFEADEPAGQPVRLFSITDTRPRRSFSFDVTADTSRFVVSVPQEASEEPPTLHLVYNWSRELQSLMGGDR